MKLINGAEIVNHFQWREKMSKCAAFDNGRTDPGFRLALSEFTGLPTGKYPGAVFLSKMRVVHFQTSWFVKEMKRKLGTKKASFCL